MEEIKRLIGKLTKDGGDMKFEWKNSKVEEI